MFSMVARAVRPPGNILCGPHGADINGTELPIDGEWVAGR